ncbi:hypothetical protein K1T71_015249, partial [Dendrolimus kikuchii]
PSRPPPNVGHSCLHLSRRSTLGQVFSPCLPRPEPRCPSRGPNLNPSHSHPPQ